MSKESISDRGHRSDDPVDLDELHEQEEHSSTASTASRWRRSDGPVDLDELHEHEQEQYASSFRPVSHNSIVSGKNNNMSLPHCRAIAATNNNTSNSSDNNINDTINGINNVQSNNSTIIDNFPRLQSMLDEPMNDKLRDWARRHPNICSSSSSIGSGNGSYSFNDTINGKDNVESNNDITIDSNNNANTDSNNNTTNSNNNIWVSTDISTISKVNTSIANNNNVNNNMNNNVNNNVNNVTNTCNSNTINVNTAVIKQGLYPADTYSILAIHGPIESPAYFSFGLLVYLFQIIFLLLMVLSVVHPNWSNNGDVDNPDGGTKGITQRLAQFIPANVDPLVRATQIMATLSYIIFADSTINDVVLGVELFPNFKQKTPDDKVGCMVFSSILRLSQGMLATIVTLFLIVTTSNVIEIILNFSAINFISTLDNVGFKVIKWGNYGTKFQDEAYCIENKPLPTCISRKRGYWASVLPIGVILMACLCSIIILQDSNNVWVTKIFRVKFQDTEQGLQHYSGCYMMNENAKEQFKRKLYNRSGNNSESAKIGYCMEKRRWIVFKGDTNITCEEGENDNELAHSSKTDFFDISTSFSEIWYSASNTPLDLYFIEFDEGLENECEQLGDGICDVELNFIDYDYDGGVSLIVPSYFSFVLYFLNNTDTFFFYYYPNQ
jgi:hypothetical protein